MLNKTVLVPVTNFGTSPVIYQIPEMNITREYAPGETKHNVSVGEIRALHYMPGGRVLISDYLCVQNEELLAELGIAVEPEYYWHRADIEDLLLNQSVERLRDALDFAPEGVKMAIKTMAVGLEINDMSKRQAITDALGFNVTRAIENAKPEEGEEVTPIYKPQRRVPVNTE